MYRSNFSINEERMAALIDLVDDGKVSNSIATQKVFINMLNNEDSPEKGTAEIIICGPLLFSQELVQVRQRPP